MNLKDGKDLSLLEIKNRLKLMEIKYDSEIKDKKYYVDLYNNAIKSKTNKEKIINELKKDKNNKDFYNDKLRKRNEYSSENSKNKSSSDETNNLGKKNFFNDFISDLFKDDVKNNPDFIEEIYKKFGIPINAMKKYTMINLSPEAKEKIINIINFFDSSKWDKFYYIIL